MLVSVEQGSVCPFVFIRAIGLQGKRMSRSRSRVTVNRNGNAPCKIFVFCFSTCKYNPVPLNTTQDTIESIPSLNLS
jgi:hypothetical protein